MMNTKIAGAILAFAASAVAAQSEAYQQCGGNGWTGDTSCISGDDCVEHNEWYSQCLASQGDGDVKPAPEDGEGDIGEANEEDIPEPTSSSLSPL